MTDELRWGDRWVAEHPIVAFVAGVLVINLVGSAGAVILGSSWSWPDWSGALFLGLVLPGLMVQRCRGRLREAERA